MILKDFEELYPDDLVGEIVSLLPLRQGFSTITSDRAISSIMSAVMNVQVALRFRSKEYVDAYGARAETALDAIDIVDQLIDEDRDSLTSEYSTGPDPSVVWNLDENPKLGSRFVRLGASHSVFTGEFLPPLFSEGDIAVAKRILKELREQFVRMKEHADDVEAQRPIGNHHPELALLIEDMCHIWCSAANIPVSEMTISGGANSPSMNFIEAAVRPVVEEYYDRKSENLARTIETIVRSLIRLEKQNRSCSRSH